MQATLFSGFRRFAATRLMRVVSMLALAMCMVTWVAQSVSSVRDNPDVPGSPAAIAAALDLVSPDAAEADDPNGMLDCLDRVEVPSIEECEAEVVALVVMDETHDVKLFFLREFTHVLQAVVGRIPRNRDFGAITRMSSETFRPPDNLVG